MIVPCAGALVEVGMLDRTLIRCRQSSEGTAK